MMHPQILISYWLIWPWCWHYWPDHVLPSVLNTCRAWPMTWPLHISMIMHELLNKLKTSVHWSMLMSPIKPRYDHLQHGWSGHLYGTNGTWKNYPTCCALLDVGLMFILRRTDYSILIWACSPVSPILTTVIFQIIQALEQNYCVV